MMRVSQHLPCLAIVCTSVQMAGPPCVGGGQPIDPTHCQSIDPTLSVYRQSWPPVQASNRLFKLGLPPCMPRIEKAARSGLRAMAAPTHTLEAQVLQKAFERLFAHTC